MQLISPDAVHVWGEVNDTRVPASLGTACPKCGQKVVFTLADWNVDKIRQTLAASADCPSCKERAHFWTIRSPQGHKVNPEGIFMYPPAKAFFAARHFQPDVPEPLRRAFVSTIDAFNTRNYTATAVSARRTLEGIFKYRVPDDKRKQSLFQLIKHVEVNVNLAEPLTALSHAIRDGGNLGAHFDMEREPDEKLARQMVELLDYLISYLYELPMQIKVLEQQLAKTEPQAPQTADDAPAAKVSDQT
jgi:hypothetical protein